MQKKLLRAISALVCLAMICSIPAFAAEVRASSQISFCSAVLARNSNGGLSLTYYVVATGTMDSIGASSIVIERYNGSKWVEEHTYTFENTPELQTTKATQYHTNLEITPMYDESDYRAEVTFYVKNSSGSSTKLVTTNIV